MSIANIIAAVEVAVEPIIAEAKIWATKAVDFLLDVPITLGQKAVALIKETSLGTAIMNLVSAASTASVPGQDKFAAVLSAAQHAYEAFVGNGGLSGLIAAGVSVLRELIESLVTDFKQTFLSA